MIEPFQYCPWRLAADPGHRGELRCATRPDAAAQLCAWTRGSAAEAQGYRRERIKGVIAPGVEYASDGMQAVLDYTEGILDLVQLSPDVVDYLGRSEMIFFGPDEGIAPFADMNEAWDMPGMMELKTSLDLA